MDKFELTPSEVDEIKNDFNKLTVTVLEGVRSGDVQPADEGGDTAGVHGSTGKRVQPGSDAANNRVPDERIGC